jgi:RNA polymerase primary sigma factor
MDEEDEIYDDDISLNNTDEGKQETKKVEKEVISYLLENLSNREKEIIVSYYGLNDNQELTLYEIGEKMGLSAERVRQIKKVSMRKLRTKALLCEEIEEIFP